MFERCCENREEKEYQINHNPQPIKLNPKMDKNLKFMLWYLPNIDSFQSKELDLVEDKIYDDFTFSFILHSMGMKESDVCLLRNGDYIDEETWNYYENTICTKCQKIIIVTYAAQTKTHNLLRCVRNCVAHGQFSICGETFIGFNQRTTKTGVIQRAAIIKIQPKKLLNVLEQLSSPNIKTFLVKYAFERVGYKVSVPSVSKLGFGPEFRFDWLIEKDAKKYYIEIKAYKGTKFLHRELLHEIFAKAQMMNNDIPVVLMIDTSRMTKEVEKEIIGSKSIFIIDLNLTKQLLEGIDVLAQRQDIV